MSQERQTMMFSATFPNEIQRLAGDFLRNYVFLAVGRVGSAAQNIEQRVMYVEEQEKREYLLHELENWGDGRVLIFVETKRKADMLQRYLYDQRFYVSTIHGDRSQSEREEALNAFKSNRVQILVATVWIFQTCLWLLIMILLRISMIMFIVSVERVVLVILGLQSHLSMKETDRLQMICMIF